jgi:GT2 family glycosyltransferase
MSRKQKHQPKPQTLVDVCILEAGRYDMLPKCLDALYREAQTIPLSIYILDNGTPKKDSIENQHLFSYQPDKDPAKGVVNFQVKRSEVNLGFPTGSNEVARMGRSPIILFIGDDVELEPGALDKIVRRFDDPTIGVVGIKLLFPENSTSPIRPAGKVQHVGVGLNIRGETFHPLVGWSKDNPKTCVSRDVWAVTGAVFAIRRNLFNQLRGFDPIFGLGTFEDMDMCMKVRQAGHRVFLEAEAVGHHYVGATAEKLNTPFPIAQNRNIFMSRWQNSGLVFWNEELFW